MRFPRAAITQIRNRRSPGRAYYDRKLAEAKTNKEALHRLKRRISDVIYRQLLADADRGADVGPGGQTGTTLQSSVAAHPDDRLFGQATTGPATEATRTPLRAAGCQRGVPFWAGEAARMSWCGWRASVGDVRRFSAVVAVVFVGFVGCSDDNSSTTAPPTERGETLPTAIDCGTQYRPNAESLAGVEEERFAVERPSGLDGNSNRVAFDELSIEVVYNDRPDGQDVSVVVAGSDGTELERVLYQLPAALPSFAGGHGFTGLHYVSAGSAQLQWWCEAAR